MKYSQKISPIKVFRVREKRKGIHNYLDSALVGFLL